MTVEIRGPRIRLRPLRVEEQRQLWEWRILAGFSGPDSPGERERFQQRIESSGEFRDGRLWLGVELDGELIGDVEARQPFAALPAGVFEVGIAIAPERHGEGFGTETVETFTGYLFESMAAERVQGGTATWNAPMQRVFEKLGFQREGVMRAFMPTPNGRDDYLLYAVTRADWDAPDRSG